MLSWGRSGRLYICIPKLRKGGGKYFQKKLKISNCESL